MGCKSSARKEQQSKCQSTGRKAAGWMSVTPTVAHYDCRPAAAASELQLLLCLWVGGGVEGGALGWGGCWGRPATRVRACMRLDSSRCVPQSASPGCHLLCHHHQIHACNIQEYKANNTTVHNMHASTSTNTTNNLNHTHSLTLPAWSLTCQQLMGGWWLICSAHTLQPQL